jgi:phosphoribosylformylglycinamidine synthase
LRQAFCAHIGRGTSQQHIKTKAQLLMKVRINVSLKPGVLDPQGRAVHHSLEGLGFTQVSDVRIGRTVELEVADNTTDAALDDMCQKLLANMVIEDYQIERLG